MADESEVMIVCTLRIDDPGYFRDNRTGACARCGAEVIYRPSIPQPSTLICGPCYAREASPDHEIRITAETLREFSEWRRRN